MRPEEAEFRARLIRGLIERCGLGGDPILRTLMQRLARSEWEPIVQAASRLAGLDRRERLASFEVCVQLVGTEAAWRLGRLSAVERRHQAQRLCQRFRQTAPPMVEALANYLAAAWVEADDPRLAIQMLHQARAILWEQVRQARLQGRSALEDEHLLQSIVQRLGDLTNQMTKAEAPAPDLSPTPPAPEAGRAGPSAPDFPLRPARLMLRIPLFPDAHLQAREVRFMDPETARRESPKLEVILEILKVEGQYYTPYVERDQPSPILLPQGSRLLRVRGESMRGAGIVPGDLIVAGRVPDHEARDVQKWNG